MRADDCCYSPVEVPTEGNLFARCFSVHVNKDQVGFGLELMYPGVCGRHERMGRVHSVIAAQVENSKPHAILFNNG
ncbi:unannotated protein [freshwater metagenome]|uniref:Unannotated protein n=1 Tax=freshwater metagenome TaxID=449393 RepID=A0A6J7EDM1_9ZZZZ